MPLLSQPHRMQTKRKFGVNSLMRFYHWVFLKQQEPDCRGQANCRVHFVHLNFSPGSIFHAGTTQDLQELMGSCVALFTKASLSYRNLRARTQAPLNFWGSSHLTCHSLHKPTETGEMLWQVLSSENTSVNISPWETCSSNSVSRGDACHRSRKEMFCSSVYFCNLWTKREGTILSENVDRSFISHGSPPFGLWNVNGNLSILKDGANKNRGRPFNSSVFNVKKFLYKIKYWKASIWENT